MLTSLDYLDGQLLCGTSVGSIVMISVKQATVTTLVLVHSRAIKCRCKSLGPAVLHDSSARSHDTPLESFRFAGRISQKSFSDEILRSKTTVALTFKT